MPTPDKSSTNKDDQPLLMDFKHLPRDGLPFYTESQSQTHRSNAWNKPFLTLGSLCILLLLSRNVSLSYRSGHATPSIVRNPAYLITADHGAVASENKRCSDIGVNVLKDGGNAVDAAISAGFCVGVVNMFS
jgi:gamma-glutamyltranspeptidase/glutathione hydrolase/leukotriene-C4 hydrolase